MSINNILSNTINSRINNVYSRLFTVKFNLKLCACGSIISYPFYIYKYVHSDAYYTDYHITDYVEAGVVSTVPSFFTGIITPIMLYTSPVWFTMYVFDKKK